MTERQRHVRGDTRFGYGPYKRNGGVPEEVFAAYPKARQAAILRLVSELEAAVEEKFAADAAVPVVAQQDAADRAAAVQAGVKQMPRPNLPAAEARAREADELVEATRAALVAECQAAIAELNREALVEAAERAERNVLEEGVSAAENFRQGGAALGRRAVHRGAAVWIRGLLETDFANVFMEHVAAAMNSYEQSASWDARQALEAISRDIEGEPWRAQTVSPAAPGTVRQPGNPNVASEDRAAQRDTFRTSGLAIPGAES